MDRKAEERLTRARSTDIHYVDEGTGEPLILLHGWAGDHTVWLPMIDHLKSKYRVIAIDIRGHGQSKRASDAYLFKDLASVPMRIGPYPRGRGIGLRSRTKVT